MYKRPTRIDAVLEHNTMDYAERGERCDDCNISHAKRGNDGHFRISKSLIVNCFMYAIIFMVFFGGFMEITANRHKVSIENAIARRLQEKRPELQKCIRTESNNASQHVMCYANQARVLIVSDTEQDRDILTEGKYREIPMYYMNIHDLYSTSHDVIDFFKTFDSQSPWIFVDGAYVGNRKDMDEYHDYDVLETGVKDAPLPPHLNEDELRFIHSSNFKKGMSDRDIQEMGINPLRVRKHLREKYIAHEENKHQKYLKNQLDILLNHQKTVEHIDMIQKAQNGEFSAHYVEEKKD